MHDKLALVEDVVMEIVLVRACADVSKVCHKLRVVGANVPAEDLNQYDELLNSVLQRMLGGLLANRLCSKRLWECMRAALDLEKRGI